MRSIVIISLISITNAFSPSNIAHNMMVLKESSIVALKQSSQNDIPDEKSSIDVMMGKVNIPDEYKEEIFKAEANTPAAKERATRVAIFGSIALLGIAISSFNAFLSNVRDGSDLTPINELGFGWVGSNPITSFWFLNKFGGGIALLSAGLGGTMVELEQRTKNENAEKIWIELQRRKSQAESGKKKKSKSIPSSSKKTMSKKSRKRLDALSEVIIETVSKEQVDLEADSDDREMIKENEVEGSNDTSKIDSNIFGKVQQLYERADSMAQSQALLLNKELEDRGIIDKITDETGLKVIGKEAAENLQKKNSNSNN